MSARVCPTPFKQAFPSRKAAGGGKVSNHKKRAGRGRRLTAYHCTCGQWHLRSWNQDRTQP